MANKILCLFLIAALYSCSAPKPMPTVSHGLKDDSQAKAYTFVPIVYDKFTLSDARAFKVGMWALYKVKEKKAAIDLKISVVQKDGENFWVEINKVGENSNKEHTSVQLVTPDSKVLAAFYTENGGAVVKQEIAPEPQKVEAEWPKTEEKITPKQSVKCQAGNFTADLHFYSVTQEDGSQTVEKKYISKGVPPLFEKGLVLSEGVEKSIELAAFGNDAKPSVTIPK